MLHLENNNLSSRIKRVKKKKILAPNKKPSPLLFKVNGRSLTVCVIFGLASRN